MKRPNYKIYPSLLDKFQKYLDSEIEADSFFNIDLESGEQKLTADEIADKHEKELIDTINRVPNDPIEAADKGTCFNEIVDCIIDNRKCEREDMTIEKNYDNCDYEFGSYVRCNSVAKPDGAVYGLKATLNNFEFLFDIDFCKKAATYFKGAITQHLCKGQIETKYGTVELYGYADEIVANKVYDIKTTNSYDFGKFERSWQKDVYPYCLIESGEMTEVAEFEYTVYKLKGGSSRTPLISGDQYREVYTYNHANSTERIRTMLENQFLPWLEAHKEQITNTKIFGN